MPAPPHAGRPAGRDIVCPGIGMDMREPEQADHITDEVSFFDDGAAKPTPPQEPGTDQSSLSSLNVISKRLHRLGSMATFIALVPVGLTSWHGQLLCLFDGPPL